MLDYQMTRLPEAFRKRELSSVHRLPHAPASMRAKIVYPARMGRSFAARIINAMEPSPHLMG